MKRNGDWIRTYTGKQFYTVDPRVNEVDILDIAHGLSLSCRYTGQCNEFYSVAEHCCHLYDNCSKENRFWALMHDASEAYIADINRPTKPYLSNYKTLEDAIMRVVCLRFGLPPVMPGEVMTLDYRILKDEMEQNMNTPWAVDVEPLGVKLQLWNPKEAEAQFMARFKAEYNGV